MALSGAFCYELAARFPRTGAAMCIYARLTDRDLVFSRLEVFSGDGSGTDAALAVGMASYARLHRSTVFVCNKRSLRSSQWLELRRERSGVRLGAFIAVARRP